MTCQLCGKPLPKMWLRRDGNFCCREHREQYRLRRGLNVLQEADELATLRRRRERPAAMSLQRPAGSAWDTPRRLGGCAYPCAAHQPEDRFGPPLAIVSEMRLQPAEQILVLPRGHLGVASCARRAAPVSRGIAPCLLLTPSGAAPRSVTTEARVPGAMGFQAPRAARANAAAGRRALNGEAPPPRAPLVPRHEIAPAAPRIGRSQSLREAAQAMPAPAAARRGTEARFAAGGPPALPAHHPPALVVHPPAARFNAARIPAASRHGRHAPGELARRDPRASIRFADMAARLARPHAECRLGEAGGMKRSAAGGKQAAARRGFAPMPFPAGEPAPGSGGTRSPLRAAAVQSAAQLRAMAPPAPAPPPGQRISFAGGWTPAAVVEPAPSVPRSRTRARTAEVAQMNMAPRMALDAMRPRAAAVKRDSENFAPVAPACHAAPLAGRGRVPLSAHRNTALASARGEAARQIALVAVPRHEPLFNQNPLTLQGTFMGTMEDAGTCVRLEENFAAGLNRWVGQVETWRLDAAGVRAGGLALFGPSLGMRDCEMEFLAKVESGGAGWVFRAADLNNYYHVRLRLAGTTAKPVWELVRGAMVNGTAEPPVTVPLDIALRAKASFRLQMAVEGNDFTVAVEGQEVASWSDSRLRAGGIGFWGEKDDRARLYWVRVASPAFGVNDE